MLLYEFGDTCDCGFKIVFEIVLPDAEYVPSCGDVMCRDGFVAALVLVDLVDPKAGVGCRDLKMIGATVPET